MRCLKKFVWKNQNKLSCIYTYIILLIGLLLRTSICGWVTDKQKFDDQFVWELEEQSQDESPGKNRKDNTHASNQIAIGHF